MNLNSQLVKELSDKEYRDGYVSAQVSVNLPLQIRAIRASRKLTQLQLAELAEMKQARISELETPGGRSLNLRTVLRIASALDVALEVKLVPFSELVQDSERFDPDKFTVKSFGQEVNELREGNRREKIAALSPNVIGQFFDIANYRRFAEPLKNIGDTVDSLIVRFQKFDVPGRVQVIRPQISADSVFFTDDRTSYGQAPARHRKALKRSEHGRRRNQTNSSGQARSSTR